MGNKIKGSAGKKISKFLTMNPTAGRRQEQPGMAPALPELTPALTTPLLTQSIPPLMAPSPALTSSPFVAPAESPAEHLQQTVQPNTDKFGAVIATINNGIDAIREVKTAPRTVSGGSNETSGSGGLSLGWTSEGLSLGGGVTLSPIMLLLGAAGLFLLFREPPGRRR